ncbi:MAG: glutathione synthase [Sedimenticola sp.]|uniref:Glutathione synthetase n=1 Tax=Sedimenticola thiotaurini TaxID=1543721 RepID=A0A558DC52_9GAMM|nr:glutathione synthase [Sedimenticola sp.]TVT58590.1 MAG: glutathione synthase [Sedimenticola thiotaurini]MCW8881339.1 glutathione synthase [Sedimenticola sp.]MCW8946242.1 glutathione synthase [Sedimenticola sp.]MCW8950768.1 glutathione synthase [Sedimenticola sp.]
MTITLGVVMDPIESINIKKDSTFAMLLEAQQRGWNIRYMEQGDLYLENDRSYARTRSLQVEENPLEWFRFLSEDTLPLDELDVILMRKDPPFDMEYIYTTYLLEKAEERGVLIINRPSSLRDCNEKLFTAWFPQCCTPTLVTSNKERILNFIEQQKDVILKPLDGMGGSSIFRSRQGDPNTNVIIETLTNHGHRYAMVQRFVPEISKGDKRILMIDGEPVPYSLARIPKPGETRGNLAAGGTGQGLPLSEQDRWIALQVGPSLRQRGILFAGLDVIGDYLTEINVTSPTCIRELDSQFGLNISAQLMDCIEEKLSA